MLAACLCLPADLSGMDPIDRAFANAVERWPDIEKPWRDRSVVDFTPFDPVTKIITAVVKDGDGQTRTCVRGAPKAVLEMCSKDNPGVQPLAEGYKNAASTMAQRGERSLGVAWKSDRPDANWELLGLVPLLDPIRVDTGTAVQQAEALGISVKMFTGDATVIAEEAARSCSLTGSDVITADTVRDGLLRNPTLQTQHFISRTLSACAFSEMFPKDKALVVDLFRNHGHKVAVTGDGVNDSAALLKADCGIAVEGASEAAQSAADIVFLVAGISRIVDAIQVSRQVLQQMRTYVVYRAIIGLHLCIILLGTHLAYGSSPVDLRWLLVNIHISDLIGVTLCYDDGKTPIPKKSARWNLRALLRTTLILSIFLVAGSWLTVLALPEAKSGLRQQTLFLNAVLTEHWLCLLILTNGRFWKFMRHWRGLGAVLSVDPMARLSHFGWAGDGAMNAAIAARIWVIGLCTLLISGVLCRYLADGELVYKKVCMEGEEEDDWDEMIDVMVDNSLP